MNDSPGHNHVQQHEFELDVLCGISRILSRDAGPRKTLLEILDVLERDLGMCRGTIMLLSPDGSELHVDAAKSVDNPEQKAVRYQRGEGITGRVLQSGEPAVIPKISQEPEFRDRIHRRGSEADELSFICVPIVLDNEVVGTLSVDVPYDPNTSLGEQRRVLSIVSSMIANNVKARRLANLERKALEEENLRLRNALEEQFRPENIIGNSHAMKLVYQRIHQVAGSDTTALIRGESGTGKELVASAVHYNSPRSSGPFVKVNCAALSESLLESELFGHEKGAFTGATAQRKGRIEEAEGGTLFLDEIGDFTPRIQVKLLRVLQERELERVGSNQTRKINVRIIAATNRDLESAVDTAQFRQDLYYRINVFPIHLPPLRERRDDILLLADHFAQTHAEKMGKPIRRISTTAINMMMQYHWPGNVRELENCIEHAVLLSRDGVIHGGDLPPTLQTPDDNEDKPVGSLKARVQLLEKDAIMDALKCHEGSVKIAAEELGITARMVRYKIKKLGIDYPRYFRRG